MRAVPSALPAEKARRERILFMNILCIADEEDRGLWDYYRSEKLKDVDLIISCGDLDPDYLQFLVTVKGCPLLYVHGNHDEKYAVRPPLGCICIEDSIYNFRGVRILGLGGSLRYKPGEHMYSEREMRRRISRLGARLMITGGFDILVTHAPARGYGDQDDLPHQGFSCFNTLLEKYHPAYMLHGHVHKSYGNFVRERNHPSGTVLINACEKAMVTVSEEQHPERGKTGSPLYDLYIRMKKDTDW